MRRYFSFIWSWQLREQLSSNEALKELIMRRLKRSCTHSYLSQKVTPIWLEHWCLAITKKLIPCCSFVSNMHRKMGIKKQLRTVDTDVAILAISTCNDLALSKLWIYFGTKKSSVYTYSQAECTAWPRHKSCIATVPRIYRMWFYQPILWHRKENCLGSLGGFPRANWNTAGYHQWP